MKNAFYFTLKVLFAVKIFKVLSWLFWYVGKRIDKKARVDFITYDVKTSETNNHDTHIVQYQEVKAIRQWNLVGS